MRCINVMVTSCQGQIRSTTLSSRSFWVIRIYSLSAANLFLHKYRLCNKWLIGNGKPSNTMRAALNSKAGKCDRRPSACPAYYVIQLKFGSSKPAFCCCQTTRDSFILVYEPNYASTALFLKK